MRRSLPLVLALAVVALLAALVWWAVVPSDTGSAGGRTYARAPQTSPAPRPEPDLSDPIATRIDAETPAVWPADAPRTVLGTVTDPEGGPVRGALVTLSPAPAGAPTLRARTDAQGQYRIARVPPNLLAARFEAAGYVTLDLAPGPLAREARVTLDATLALRPGVRGRVEGPEGPAGGAFVGLQREGDRGFPARAFADHAGRFFLPIEEDGDWTLSASHSHHGRVEEPVSLPIAGEVVLRLPGGGYVEGRAVDERGAPVTRFSVAATATAFGAAPPTQSFDDPDGRFRIGPIAAGRLRLQGAAEGHQPAESERLELGSGETLSDVVLRLPRSAQLVGRVTDGRTGKPIEGARVVPAEWGSATLADAVGVETDADGRYRLTALPGRRSSIQVSAEGYRSLMLGGVDGQPGEATVRDFVLNRETPGVPGGELTGVGAVLRGHREGVVIDQLVPGGPAEGVLDTGDVVVAVDGRPARGLGMGGVANAIRGEEGTDVVLKIRKGGEGEVVEVVLRRGRVAMPPPRAMPPHHN